jgi:uncharacterized protein YggT (Ycf19 family)
MSTTRGPDTREAESVDRPVVERVQVPASVEPTGQVNVNANPNAPAWTATRVILLVFTVLEVLLLIRFGLKLFGANAQQALVAGLYGITEPLVRPFQGIWPETTSPVVFDLPALLAIVVLLLIAALVVAVMRAVAGSRSAV